MNARNRFSQWEKLDINPRTQVSTPRRIFKILTNIFLVGMVVIFFWGMGTVFLNSAVQATTVPVDSAQNVDYVAGVFFEITAGFETVINDTTNKINDHKSHILFWEDGEIQEHRYYPVNSFGNIWDAAQAPSYLFVLPINWLITKLSLWFGWRPNALGSNFNLFTVISAMFFVTLLLRLFNFSNTWKQKKNQNILENLKTQTTEIKAKHANSNDPMAKQREKQDIMMLYRQHNINPLSSVLQGFAFMPVLFTMFIAVRYGRIIKESSTAVFSLTKSIWSSLSTDFFAKAVYLIPVVVYVFLFSFDLFLSEWFFKKKPKFTVASAAANKSQKKQKLIKWGFRLMFFVFFFVVPTGTSIYWIFNSFFEIIQKILLEFFTKLSKKKAALKKKGINSPLWKLVFSPLKVK